MQPEGATPLMYAIRAGDVQAVARLLEAGADPAAPGPNGETSLTLAAHQPNAAALVRLLVQAGARVNAVGPEGVTPLMVAVQSGNLEAVTELLAHGADRRAANIHGLTALDVARWRQITLHVPFLRAYWSFSVPAFRRRIRAALGAER